MTDRQRTRSSGATDSTLRIAGLPVARAGIAPSMQRLWEDASAKRPRVYVFVNAYSSLLTKVEPEYASALEDPRTIPLLDSAALALGAWIMGGVSLERCPGPDFFEAACSAEGMRFYLLGGGEGVVDNLRMTLGERFPSLRVVGARTPPFGEWDAAVSDDLCAAIDASEADIVWVGVSAPKQELWALEHVDRIGRPVVCVGAAFDFLSGAKPRAPRAFRALGLEWLFRLLSEPRRLWKRYLIGNTYFVWDLVRHGVKPADDASRFRGE